MTTPTDKLADLIASAPSTPEAWHAAVDSVFIERNKPIENTIYDINDPDDEAGMGYGIHLFPDDENGIPQWRLYIPVTTDPQTWDDEQDDFNLGYSTWSSLEAATLSLLIAVRAGVIKYNDGRTVS